MAALLERSQVGKREDLADLISNVDQKITPLTSRIRNGDAPGNTLMQWQADAYDDVSIGGAMDNTDTTSFDDFSNRAVLYNTVQIFERAPQVSRLAERISDVAGQGKKKEMAKQVAKGIVLQKRDIEAAFCSRNIARQEDASNSYLSRGLRSYIMNTRGTSAGEPGYNEASGLQVPAAFTPSAAQVSSVAAASFNDDSVRDVMEAIWNNTGASNSFIGLCGSGVKKKISNLVSFVQASSTGVQVNAQLNDNKVTEIVDIVDTDFGVVELALSQFLDVGHDGSTNAADPNLVYFLDMDRMEARWESRPSFKSFEDKGGGPRGLIESVCSLVCHNPLSLGSIELT